MKNQSKKKRAVMNIRELNKIIISDVYVMFIQIDIIAIVVDCKYVSIIDAIKYFYQWKVKLKNRFKQTVISHQKQKQFNVIDMNFKNSFVYVQRQTNFFFKNLREFAKIFIDDIVIFSQIKKKHLKHLKTVFERLFSYDVIFNSTKNFLNFFFWFC